MFVRIEVFPVKGQKRGQKRGQKEGCQDNVMPPLLQIDTMFILG